MNRRLIMSCAAVIVSTPVFSQSTFQGLYGQVATGYELNNASSLNGTIVATPGGADNTNNLSASNQNFGGMPLVLGLGYNFAVSTNWLLGLGVDYSAISQNSSSYSYANLGVDIPDGAQLHGAQLKASNRFNVFITPSFAIDSDKLVYAKAGYSSVQAQFQAPTSFSIAGSGNIPLGIKFAQGQSTNLKGFLLGLGYKQMIGSGLYGFTEANYMSYGNATITTFGASSAGRSPTTLSPTMNLSSYQFLVGLGYQF